MFELNSKRKRNQRSRSNDQSNDSSSSAVSSAVAVTVAAIPTRPPVPQQQAQKQQMPHRGDAKNRNVHRAEKARERYQKLTPEQLDAINSKRRKRTAAARAKKAQDNATPAPAPAAAGAAATALVVAAVPGSEWSQQEHEQFVEALRVLHDNDTYDYDKDTNKTHTNTIQQYYGWIATQYVPARSVAAVRQYYTQYSNEEHPKGDDSTSGSRPYRTSSTNVPSSSTPAWTLGSRVGIFWAEEGKYYLGTVTKKRHTRFGLGKGNKTECFVEYDDNREDAWIDISTIEIRLQIEDINYFSVNDKMKTKSTKLPVGRPLGSTKTASSSTAASSAVAAVAAGTKTVSTTKKKRRKNVKWEEHTDILQAHVDARNNNQTNVTDTILIIEPQEEKPPTTPQGQEDDEAPLPEGWTQHLDPNTGLYYYYNAMDGTASWEWPKIAEAMEIEAALPIIAATPPAATPTTSSSDREPTGTTSARSIGGYDAACPNYDCFPVSPEDRASDNNNHSHTVPPPSRTTVSNYIRRLADHKEATGENITVAEWIDRYKKNGGRNRIISNKGSQKKTNTNLYAKTNNNGYHSTTDTVVTKKNHMSRLGRQPQVPMYQDEWESASTAICHFSSSNNENAANSTTTAITNSSASGFETKIEASSNEPLLPSFDRQLGASLPHTNTDDNYWFSRGEDLDDDYDDVVHIRMLEEIEEDMIEEMEAQVDGVNKELEEMEAQVDGVNKELGEIEAQVDGVNKELGEIEEGNVAGVLEDGNDGDNLTIQAFCDINDVQNITAV